MHSYKKDNGNEEKNAMATKKCVVECENTFEDHKNRLKAKQLESNCDELENNYNVDK